jgi:hypothetical protein
MNQRRRIIEMPGLLSTVLVALISALFGVALAAFGLVLKPVAVRQLSAPAVANALAPERHDVVYTPGREPVGLRSPEWEAKRRAFNAKSTNGVMLTEQDVNRWISMAYGEVDRTFKLESYELEIRPGLPMARFDGSVMHFGMLSDVKQGESKTKFVVQAEGDFQNRDGRFVFVPKKLFVGSCPVPMQLVGPRIYDWFARPFVVPEDVAKTWAAAKDVTVSESRLKIGFN